MNSQKYAVISGGTKGIGRAIVEALLNKGFHVATCSRSLEDLETLKKEIDSDDRLMIFPADFGNTSAVNAFAAKINSEWPHVDVLVNNTGQFIPGSVLDEPAGRLETMFQVNVLSAYYLTRALAGSLIKAKKGYIFNMCSVASKFAYPNGGSYSISKFALLGFSKVLREELKERNIAVCSILPGATWSDSWKDVELPEDRLMQASDIAQILLAQLEMSPSAVIEEIVLRPQLGDL
jgi:short-subunit dehydrogenase